MQGYAIRQALRQQERIYGTHIVSLQNPVAARITSDLEIDFVFICTEHMPLDRTETSMMCQYYSARGISPMVRIPYPSSRWAAMAIDAGAQGIVAPYVETVDEVKELIGAVRYRPIKGRFLQEMLDNKRVPQPKLASFYERFNRDLYLILGIESVEAIEHLEALIDFDGVDGIFLGPHDITCSMEIPEEYENPRFIAVIEDVIRRCRKLHKSVCFHYDLTSPLGERFIAAGMTMFLHWADVVKMRQTMNNDFRSWRQRFGDIYSREERAAASKLCIEGQADKKP